MRKDRIEGNANVIGEQVYLDLVPDQELRLPDGSSVSAGSRFDVRVDVVSAPEDDGSWSAVTAHLIPEFVRDPGERGPDGMYRYSDAQKVFCLGFART